MAKSMRMEQLPQLKKSVERQQQQQPSAKGVVITCKCKSFFLSKNSWSYNKKEVMNNFISKSGSGSGSSFVGTSRCSGKMNKRNNGDPSAAIHLIVSLIDCVSIQGLTFSGFILGMLLVIVAMALFGLFEYLKTWRWLRMHQLRMSKNMETRLTEKKTTSTFLLGITEDLVSGIDVSGIDDLFITTCILVGLGFLCGFLAILRTFHSKSK